MTQVIQYKALSIWQPWATYMQMGLKQYETRSWHPGNRLVKEEIVVIHAALRWQRDQADMHQRLMAQWPDVADLGPIHDLGCIVGAFRYLGAAPCEDVWEDISPLERALGDYGPRRYAWQFELVKVAMPPIPARGQQGIWRWSMPVTEGGEA